MLTSFPPPPGLRGAPQEQAQSAPHPQDGSPRPRHGAAPRRLRRRVLDRARKHRGAVPEPRPPRLHQQAASPRLHQQHGRGRAGQHAAGAHAGLGAGEAALASDGRPRRPGCPLREVFSPPATRRDLREALWPPSSRGLRLRGGTAVAQVPQSRYSLPLASGMIHESRKSSARHFPRQRRSARICRARVHCWNS